MWCATGVVLMMISAAFDDLGLRGPLCPKLTVVVVGKVGLVSRCSLFACSSVAIASPRPFLPHLEE